MGKGSTCAGLLLPYHCVTALFCHAGARPVSCSSLREAFLVAPRARRQVARAAHRAQPSDPPSSAIPPRAGDVPRWGPSLFVRSHATDTPPRDARSVPARSGEMAPDAPGADLTTTPRSPRSCSTGVGNVFGRAEKFRRCRGWPISPEPAGTGRASRVGETAARLHANAEGPRRGSRSPVAGEGVCRRRARGRTSLQLATAAPAKNKPHAVKHKTKAAHHRGSLHP